MNRSLVVPMYQEAGRIGASVAALAASALNRPGTEFVLVDDGSTDGTFELAERATRTTGLPARVLRHERNLGKGAAIRTGVLAAAGEVIAFVDADLAAGAEEIERCFVLVERGDAEVVFTTRLHADSVIHQQPPITRRVSGKVFNALLRRLGLTRYSDTQCGLKAFTADAAAELFTDLRIAGFAFDVEILFRAERAGRGIVELPIRWGHVEDSRVSPLRDGMRMARDVLRLRWAVTGRRPTPRPASAVDGAMTDAQFDVMYGVERTHWWWRAKRELVLQELRREGEAAGAAVDVGCGTGEMATVLSGLGFKPALGTDRSSYALAIADARDDPAVALVAAVGERLPFADGGCACLTSLDVLEHMDDDVAALREFARVVRPGGLVLVAVPAYQWAWSDHDVALGHRRRYTTRSLVTAARAAGLEVVRTTHYHSWLVPVALLLRRTPLGRLQRRPAEEAGFVAPGVNRLLFAVAGTERRLAGRVRIPFGLSVLLTARVPAASP